MDSNENLTINQLLLSSSSSNGSNHDDQQTEFNHRMKQDFMSYCYSFVRDDDEARSCIEHVWKKYYQSVGEVAMLAAFFETLPFHIKTSVLPKYQDEIVQWCRNVFHIQPHALLCSIYYSETFQRVIQHALKPGQYKKGIIYVPSDFDPNLKIDLMSTISNIKFEHLTNENAHEDLINLQQLKDLIQRDSNDSQVYPLMIVANAGSALLGRCDQLIQLKKLCEENQMWLHLIGDLLGSFALLSTTPKVDLKLNCDSMTMDIMKLFGIQNLPYLTFFLRSISNDDNDEKKNTSNSTPSIYDLILHSPSIGFLSVWSLTQRCSNENILAHMKQAFQLTNNLFTRLKEISTMEILDDNDDDDDEQHQREHESNTYQNLCSNLNSNEILPRSVVVFRFHSKDFSEIENIDDFNNYLDLLNLWLFDKLSQQYPKMNLELLKTTFFQSSSTNHPVYALRFAPLEHLVDTIEPNDMQSYVDDIQRFSDILLATMTARIQLASAVTKYENLISVPMPNWAGIGAVRYIPTSVDASNINETSTYEINSIQAELARQLQNNDSAFSLGGGSNEDPSSMFYLRLGMIRKREDLDILLQKISTAGKETETSLKYIEAMAEKIKAGIEKVQNDLYNENLQLLAQDGLLRQLPIVSNFMSWWSPAPSASPLATKGRSFDLNSGEVESTEDTYVHRMQIKKQTSHPPTHNHLPTNEPSDVDSSETNPNS